MFGWRGYGEVCKGLTMQGLVGNIAEFGFYLREKFKNGCTKLLKSFKKKSAIISLFHN